LVNQKLTLYLVLAELLRRQRRPEDSTWEYLLFRPKTLPGEDSMHIGALSHAYLAELAPQTAMETSLANDLFLVELDLQRQRGYAEQCLLAEYRRIAADVLRGRGVFCIRMADPELDRADDLAKDLTSKDRDERNAAEAEIASFGYSLVEIRSRAYDEVSRTMAGYDDRIAALESRRRRLLEDYDKLKAKRSRPADVIEIRP
jgi:hypothetical protein